MAASVRARLRNLAQDKGEDFGLILGYYAIERLLYRLGVSSFAEHFVLIRFGRWKSTDQPATLISLVWAQ